MEWGLIMMLQTLTMAELALKLKTPSYIPPFLTDQLVEQVTMPEPDSFALYVSRPRANYRDPVYTWEVKEPNRK